MLCTQSIPQLPPRAADCAQRRPRNTTTTTPQARCGRARLVNPCAGFSVQPVVAASGGRGWRCDRLIRTAKRSGGARPAINRNAVYSRLPVEAARKRNALARVVRLAAKRAVWRRTADYDRRRRPRFARLYHQPRPAQERRPWATRRRRGHRRAGRGLRAAPA
ncbi:MAG: hypothetical protein Pg6A_11150 [Termitinemataceae bacterium]|nr:MAG: hypothetical protein Pg6A_11150 [Termitinemataceae bacterium]